jgi:hypothetical protein
VPIDVHRHLDRVVPELVLHVDDRLPVLEQAGGERMAEIVEANPPEPRLLKGLVEDASLDV